MAREGRAQEWVNLLQNSNFDAGTIAPWKINSVDGANATYGIAKYLDTTALEMFITAGPVPEVYDVELNQSVSVELGQKYRIGLWAMSLGGSSVPALVKVGQKIPPYTSYLPDTMFTIPTGGQTFNWELTSTGTDINAGFVIFLGSKDAHIKIDAIYFMKQVPVTAGAILGNQVGYPVNGAKRATVLSASPAALDWELMSSGGQMLAAGKTIVKGVDPTSGDSLHVIDFSTFAQQGTGLYLRIGPSQSQPFDVLPNVYQGLRRDAMRFFYHQRCSSAITAPYAEGAQWERGAGHPDTSVPCLPGSGCAYSLNVSKGWYDAGDHGKYVVNGGISLWTLLNLFERTQHLGTTLTELGDTTLHIPESGNGVPDWLDEARWEMEFMLGMQVPDGQPLAGMAHHKVHDHEWTPVPTIPANDNTPRDLHPPSTAATLNLAASAAQCARVWKTVDTAFSNRCLTAATKAWTAAKANPALYASTDGTMGGGTYADTDVSDELYWAAAELYITTGQAAYETELSGSPHFATVSTSGPPFSWNTVAALGTASLAIAPSVLSSAKVAQMRQAVVNAADATAARIGASGYGSPVTSYVWGSSSDVLNSGILLALAHDITGDAKYYAGAIAAMDHVLGRNPLDRSYVTGHGERAFLNPHHRFFAHDADPIMPLPPPGFVAGGPNQMLDGLPPTDPLTGCTSMKCWRDDYAAYSLTEVAINWNAPLAWLAAWLSEMGTNPPSTHPGITPGTGGAGGAGSGSTGTGTSSGGAGGGGAGSGGGTGNGGAGGSGGAGASGGQGSSTTSAGSGNGGAGGEPAGGGSSEGGCGCGVAGDPAEGSAALLAGAVAAALRRRRRARTRA